MQAFFERSTRAAAVSPVIAALLAGGCTGISIAPSCPNDLAVGESAPLLANEINPGEIPRYLWEVIPPGIGRVTEPTAASTRFEAISEGEAKVQLTASDGLFMVVSSCSTRVSGVVEPPDNTNDNDDNGNTNDNDNDNDNNSNDNGGGKPGRGKRRP